MKVTLILLWLASLPWKKKKNVYFAKFFSESKQLKQCYSNISSFFYVLNSRYNKRMLWIYYMIFKKVFHHCLIQHCLIQHICGKVSGEKLMVSVHRKFSSDWYFLNSQLPSSFSRKSINVLASTATSRYSTPSAPWKVGRTIIVRELAGGGVLALD